MKGVAVSDINPEIVGPWRKSELFSNPSGNCVELAPTAGGGAAVRNSRDPEGAVLYYTRPEINAFVRGAKAGEFDDYLI